MREKQEFYERQKGDDTTFPTSELLVPTFLQLDRVGLLSIQEDPNGRLGLLQLVVDGDEGLDGGGGGGVEL